MTSEHLWSSQELHVMRHGEYRKKQRAAEQQRRQ